MSFYSIAERQQAAIVARLESIRVGNGYLADIGEPVHIERAHFDESDVFPLLNVAMTGESVEGNPSGERVNILRTFTIELWRKRGDEPAIALCQDVKRALMAQGSLGALSDDDGKLGALEYGGTSSIVSESDGNPISGLTLTFNVRYPETWGEPRA